MKVERINNNKAKIILTHDELEKRKITLKDIEFDKKKAQDFFFDILEDANLNEEWHGEASQLLIEAATDQNNLFTITITKADCIPDITKYAVNKKRKTKSANVEYSVASFLYSFDSLEGLYAFCKKAYVENLFVGQNSLLELNGVYYLLFSLQTIKKSSFVKTFSLLSEYTSTYYSRPIYRAIFNEHANIIIPKTAIQSIQNI